MNASPRSAVLVLAGLPGSGKTALASWLSDTWDCIVISRDSIKRSMFGHHDVGTRQNRVAFDAMKAALPVAVDLARLVIMDGMPFSREGQMEAVEQAVAELAVPCVPIFMDCPVEVAQSRLRVPDPTGPHDRDAALVARVAADFRSVPASWVRVDADQSIEGVRSDIQAILKNVGVES